MKILALKIFLSCIFLSLQLTSCSTSSPVSGGVTLPNGILGVVVDEEGNPINGAKVTAKQIVITALGERVISQHETTSNIRGEYSFSSLEEGSYVIAIKHDDFFSVLSQIDVSNSDTTQTGTLVVSNPAVVVKGRIEFEDNLVVKVPGLPSTANTDENGFYTLTGVPAQNIRIAYVSQKTVNYLHIDIEPHGDTIFIRDLIFADSIEQARGYDSFYSTELENSFSIDPVNYSDQEIPNWYQEKNFSFVTYLNLIPKTYTFVAESGNFNNPLNWDLLLTPSIGDTALISGKECIINDSLISSVLYFDNQAQMVIERPVYFQQAYFSNSLLYIFNEYAYYHIEGVLHFENENEIRVNTGSLAVFNGIVGAGEIFIGWRGDVQLDGENAAVGFDGIWTIETGRLRLRTANSAGSSEINVMPTAVLDVERNWALNIARVVRLFYEGEFIATLELDAEPVIPILEINGERVAPGVYSRGDLEGHIRGDGNITVLE